jgi:hypothetical protein
VHLGSSPIAVAFHENTTQGRTKVKVAKNHPEAILVDQPDNASVADELEAITAQIGSCDRPGFQNPPFLKRRDPPLPDLVPDRRNQVCGRG